MQTWQLYESHESARCSPLRTCLCHRYDPHLNEGAAPELLTSVNPSHTLSPGRSALGHALALHASTARAVRCRRIFRARFVAIYLSDHKGIAIALADR